MRVAAAAAVGADVCSPLFVNTLNSLFYVFNQIASHTESAVLIT